jgi:hypothetical protein
MEEGDDVRINTQSWKPFFKTLGPKLESIAIRQERGLMDVVNIMDDANCQLKCLMLSSLKMGEDICKLSQSNQIKYIKELVLEDVHCKTFDWLEGLEVLEELTLVSCHSDTPLEIEITDVLNMCSPTTFKRLSIQHSKLSFDFEEAQPYHLTELSLDMAVFSLGLDKFISTYLSQLSRLELMKCKLEGRTFNFSTLKLSYLYIVEDFFPTDQDILVLTLEDNQKRWYTAESDHLYIGFYNDSNNGDIGLYPAAKSFPVDDVEAFPFFTILCHSVKDVIISNYQNFI